MEDKSMKKEYKTLSSSKISTIWDEFLTGKTQLSRWRDGFTDREEAGKLV